ncbi:hypothetical protein L6452_31102 [Arctium lappa]|uniref:Uncharacterized protein n=1 Tax=Arctium lappa TaxID=4217 RepID=A0ACB8ZK40_ARCLA|nr:hypothetical protein L6452_31102 [Arctium lappa]
MVFETGALAQLHNSKASASKSCTDLGKKRVVVLDDEKDNNDVLFQNKSGSETPIILSPQEAQANYESRLESLPLELLLANNKDLDSFFLAVACMFMMERYKILKDIGSANFGVAKLVKDKSSVDLFALVY